MQRIILTVATLTVFFAACRPPAEPPATQPRGRDGRARGPAIRASDADGAGDWWNDLFLNAGGVEHGVLTVARLVPGRGPRLAVAMINVSRQPVSIRPLGLTRAHVSDAAGRLAPLTVRGRTLVGRASLPHSLMDLMSFDNPNRASAGRIVPQRALPKRLL